MPDLLFHKILPVFVLPLGLSLLLVLTGLALRRRLPVVAGAMLLWGFSLPVVADFLLAIQEGREGRVELESLVAADAVVVLSGMLRQVPGAPLGEWNSAGDRFEAGVELWRAGKAPWLIFTGGWVPWRPEAVPEGEILRQRAGLSEVPPEAMLVTGKVGNTAAEATAVWELWHQRRAEEQVRQAPRIILVTSAFHLPRAAWLFERVGFEVRPYPVDFRRDGARRLNLRDFLPSAEALDDSEMVLREWLGLAFYRLTSPALIR